MRSRQGARINLIWSLRRGLSWWGKELFSLLPDSVQDWVRDGSVAATVSVEPADLDARRDASNQHEATLKRRVRLVLSPELSLYREVTLPSAAEENLSEVLGFEMDRFTPFKAEEVYYDYVVLERDAGRKRTRVALLVVPRGIVQMSFEASRSRGCKPVSVFLAGHPNATAFGRHHRVPDAVADQRAWWPPSWSFVGLLALLTLLLGAAALHVPTEMKKAQLAQLEIEIEQARAGAAVAVNLEKSIEARLSGADAVVQRKYALPPPVQTLTELTRLLPDGTWLGSFALQSDRLLISGLSQNASSLLEPLERADLFEQVRFASPVVNEESRGVEHFAIEMAVVGGAK